MSRVVRLRVTKRFSSGTHTRRVWMFTFCQRFVLMFECETFCAFSLRLPVMSLLAMTGVLSCFHAAKRHGARSNVPTKEILGGEEWEAHPGLRSPFCQAR